jgi:phosphoglycolate phosphatase
VKMKYESIIYDFDGVILDTVKTKIDAFLNVYRTEDQSKINEVRAYAEANGGMSRYEKFKYFESVIFKRSPSVTRLDQLCSQYGASVEIGVASARFIEGALNAITTLQGRVTQHVVSAAPEDELDGTLINRGIKGCFKSIAGAPKSKLSEFRRILREDGIEPQRILAIGDSLAEYNAALELGIPFLAIVAVDVSDRFPSSVRKAPDLVSLISHVQGTENDLCW